MSLSKIDLDALSTEEQLMLMEALWERLSRTPAALSLSPEQEAELDRRLDRIDREGVSGLSWEEVRDGWLESAVENDC